MKWIIEFSIKKCIIDSFTSHLLLDEYCQRSQFKHGFKDIARAWAANPMKFGIKKGRRSRLVERGDKPNHSRHDRHGQRIRRQQQQGQHSFFFFFFVKGSSGHGSIISAQQNLTASWLAPGQPWTLWSGQERCR